MSGKAAAGGALRAQSAMEYLMTYGWAILIIAVVLGALFSLGVFSGSTLIGTSCIAAPGYSCSSPVLLTTGVFTATLGQNTGSTEYNAFFTVVNQGSALNGVGFPTGGCYFPTNTVGLASTLCASNTANQIGLLLPTGSTNSISITLTANQVSAGFALSSTFTGYIWVNYSTTSQTAAASSSVKIATVNVKVT